MTICILTICAYYGWEDKNGEPGPYLLACVLGLAWPLALFLLLLIGPFFVAALIGEFIFNKRQC